MTMSDNYALMESMHGNETAALIFLGAYLGWSHVTLAAMCTEDGDPQMWRDLVRAAKTLQSVCAPLVAAHERAEADRRYRQQNPELPLEPSGSWPSSKPRYKSR